VEDDVWLLRKFLLDAHPEARSKITFDLMMGGPSPKYPLVHEALKNVKIGTRDEDVTVDFQSGKYKGKT